MHSKSSSCILQSPIQVTVRSKAGVCGSSLAGIVGSNPTGRHGCLSVVSVLCCKVEVCVGLIIVQRSPTKCSVSESDREAWIIKTPWPNRGCRAIGGGGGKKKKRGNF